MKLKLLVFNFDAYRRLSLLCLLKLTFGVPLASFDCHRIDKSIEILNIKIDNSALCTAGPATTFPLAKHDPTRSWASQFKIMDRLLALKKAISEYFRQHSQNPRKRTSHE